MGDLGGWAQKALLAELVENLSENGSWCGETHVQKCAYFLEDLFHVPVGYEFVLYKHGPYSFDLHDALMEMKATGVIDAESKNPYGASLSLGERGGLLLNLRRRAGTLYSREIDEVARRFGKASAAELERLSTALFITVRKGTPAEERACLLNRLKPHISISDATKAVAEVDNLLKTTGDK